MGNTIEHALALNQHTNTWAQALLYSVFKKTQLSSCQQHDFNAPDNVWMIELFELLEQGDLPQDGHRHSVLGQREPHRLQRHDGPRQSVSSLEHGSIGTWK